MIVNKRRTVSLLAAWAMALSASLAPAADTSVQQLQEQVQQLQKEVQQLKTSQNNQADITAAINSILDDAHKRSQLLGSEGFTAGYDKGKFLIQSGDGNFVFHPWLQASFRNITQYVQNGKTASDDQTTNGFELRRMKFGFDGNMFSPDLTYTVIWATNRGTSSQITQGTNGAPILEEAWARYQINDQWAVQAGQFKGFLGHEGMSSSKRILGVERSYLQDTFLFGDDFLQGAALLWGGKKDPVHVAISYTDGANSANTDFNDSTSVGNFGVDGRIEWKVFGDWKAYEQFTALDCKEDTLVLGAAGSYTEYPGTAATAPGRGMLVYTADAQYISPSGFGAYAAYVGRMTQYDFTTASNPDTVNDSGFLVQANYLFTPKWEVFARYDYLSWDPNTPTATIASSLTHHVSEICGGVNYYWHGQNAKLTLDAVWLPDGNPNIGDSGGDIAPQSNPGNQIIFRVQFQLLI